MELEGRLAVVTGAAGGIGRALCEAFVSAGARAVVAVDLAGAGAIDPLQHESQSALITYEADVSRYEQVSQLVDDVEQNHGPIDLFCSNAGIAFAGGVEVADERWQDIWDVNVMAHVYAARAVLPPMLSRGEGYLLNTASAAGLLTNIGGAAYSVTKHAAVALAEWLAITYGSRGIRVSCLCPLGVRTPMLLGDGGIGGSSREDMVAQRAVEMAGRILDPVEVASVVVAGLREERFLILPHPEVAEYVRRKADDPDRWLAGMQRLQARVDADVAGSGREP